MRQALSWCSSHKYDIVCVQTDFRTLTVLCAAVHRHSFETTPGQQMGN